MDKSREILNALDNMGIEYKLIEHEPKWTIEDCLLTPGMDTETTTMPRNVFACNRQQTDFYLILMAPLREFRTAQVSKLLGVSRLSFAPENKLQEYLMLDKGAVSPLGLLFDANTQVRLVIDDALLKYQKLWFHPGINTQSVEMKTQDFTGRFLTELGLTASIITLPQEAGDR